MLADSNGLVNLKSKSKEEFKGHFLFEMDRPTFLDNILIVFLSKLILQQ